MTRQDYYCIVCDKVTELTRSIEDKSVPDCSVCTTPMTRYFGRSHTVPVNMGWRGEHHYASKTDSDIAKFQFTHL